MPSRFLETRHLPTKSVRRRAMPSKFLETRHLPTKISAHKFQIKRINVYFIRRKITFAFVNKLQAPLNTNHPQSGYVIKSPAYMSCASAQSPCSDCLLDSLWFPLNLVPNLYFKKPNKR